MYRESKRKLAKFDVLSCRSLIIFVNSSYRLLFDLFGSPLLRPHHRCFILSSVASRIGAIQAQNCNTEVSGSERRCALIQFVSQTFYSAIFDNPALCQRTGYRGSYRDSYPFRAACPRTQLPSGTLFFASALWNMLGSRLHKKYFFWKTTAFTKYRVYILQTTRAS